MRKLIEDDSYILLASHWVAWIAQQAFNDNATVHVSRNSVTFFNIDGCATPSVASSDRQKQVASWKHKMHRKAIRWEIDELSLA